jgi:hypothetical protein
LVKEELLKMTNNELKDMLKSNGITARLPTAKADMVNILLRERCYPDQGKFCTLPDYKTCDVPNNICVRPNWVPSTFDKFDKQGTQLAGPKKLIDELRKKLRSPSPPKKAATPKKATPVPSPKKATPVPSPKKAATPPHEFEPHSPDYSPPVTPPRSPKKVATPPRSPKKVATPPRSPKKVATPPRSPKKVATPPRSPKKVATPLSISCDPENGILCDNDDDVCDYDTKKMCKKWRPI